MNQTWPIPFVALQPIYSQWQSILARGEIGHICFLPRTDREYRAKQFLQWQKLQKEKNMAVILNLTAQKVEGIEDIQLPNKPLIVYPAERLLIPDLSHLIPHFLNHAVDTGKGILFLHESWPDTVIKSTSAKTHSSFTQNISAFPLYLKKDVFSFIDYYEKSWKLQFTNREREVIYQETGGYLWLVKEILRLKKTQSGDIKDIVSTPSYKWRVREIWDSMEDDIKDVLISFLHGLNVGNEKVQVFKEYHLICKELKQKLPSSLVTIITNLTLPKLKTEDGHVFYKDRNISLSFTRKERRLLTALTADLGKVIDRYTLCSALWGESSSDFSDWALDQAVSRLRHKLKRLNIHTKIKTEKGKGYGLA